jgi:hypothetical protein
MNIVSNARVLKNPPWPLDVDVVLKMGRWKHGKHGTIKNDGTSSYRFYSKDLQSSYALYAQVDVITVTIEETGEIWDCYEHV